MRESLELGYYSSEKKKEKENCLCMRYNEKQKKFDYHDDYMNKEEKKIIEISVFIYRLNFSRVYKFLS